MARISVERAHGLGKEAAREKADKLAQKLSDQYGLEPQWSGDTLNLKRSGVKGAVYVGEDSIKVDVELGPVDVGHERHDQIGNRKGPR